jgi:hypothetical protein
MNKTGYENAFHRTTSIHPAYPEMPAGETGDGSVMHETTAYAMTFTLDQFLEHWRLLMSHLLYVPGAYGKGEGLSVRQTACVWAALLAAAAIIRQKSLWFFVGFALLAPLPVIFIPFRGFFVMYLPLAGWAAAIATVMVCARNRLVRRAGNGVSVHFITGSRCFLFIGVAALTIWISRNDPNSELGVRDPSQSTIRLMQRDIARLNEPLPGGASVLFRHDRFPADSWGLVMILRLVYRDRDLWADRPTMMKTPPDESAYDRVFDYSRGKLFLARSRAASGPVPRPLNYPR